MRRYCYSSAVGAKAGFTMIEIALSLAIIAFALVAIIGVLPQGLTIQKSNREETIINQDGPFLLETIRSGGRGVEAISNAFRGIGKISIVTTNSALSETTNEVSFDGVFPASSSNIVGLLSIPAMSQVVWFPPDQRVARVEVITRAISGNAIDKDPASDDLAFRYKVICEIGRLSHSTNGALADNLYEARLTFRWPVLENGSFGTGRKVFRTQFSGSITNFGATHFAVPLSF